MEMVQLPEKNHKTPLEMSKGLDRIGDARIVVGPCWQ